ncbi:uncharacterized protein PV06_09873 [Exophiala oligosperma]|uniref:Cytochrome P450 n=1 Tax=Exophiala oligosperma TaxID=215243 RepID=A0A0D2AC52_9EURO|nr:uncharacterized protein PV06_09873 [Exophiala oligosperma]KIW37891.1 hypothetical protein PV06_09873 [Exophiala oligosperma]
MPGFLLYLGAIVAASACFLVLRVLYRLTLHPLASFPGPKLAGATSLYQAWYDLRPSTSYVKTFPELHKKYGPIVRILPNQLHVHDINAYYEIFKSGSGFTRFKDQYHHPAGVGFFNILDPKVAKPWRDAYMPYFSKSAIGRLEPLIHDRMNTFLQKLDAAASVEKPVDLSMGYRSLTSDLVTSYMFANKGIETLEVEDFQSPMLVALEKNFDFLQYTMYWNNFFYWFAGQLQTLTKEQTEKFFADLSQQLKIKVGEIMKKGGSGSGFPTVFDCWAAPNVKRTFIPRLDQLSADAFLFYGAGTDTTAYSLTCGTWGLIHNKDALTKLREELHNALGAPDPGGKLVSPSTLENLTYLRAVVKESLRMGMGVPGRLGRVVPAGGVNLCDRQIPAGTVLHAAHYCYHFDPEVFPNPESFLPERWLGPDANQLETKMIAFSRGPRSCVGINLAYAELYLTFAYVFSRFDMKLYKTTKEDMDWKDNFVVTTKGHLRVMLKKVDDE